MVSGESAMDFGDEQSALDGSEIPFATVRKGTQLFADPNDKSQPQSPIGLRSQRSLWGSSTSMIRLKKQWRPKKGAGLMDKTNAPVSSPNTP